MDSNIVLSGQTVIIENDRIIRIGPLSEIHYPASAQIIDGKGMFLLPGLTDTHVHLDEYVGARPKFGDAPIYLSYGVTTVFNMRGDKEQLDWKKKIAADSLIAPNLYTCGEFVNEPRVSTVAEAEREVITQKNDGYDIIKFREVIDFEKGMIATTTGMEKEAYLHLNRTARKQGIPLVGHAPYRVGLSGLIEAGQSLAHMNELANLYFLAPFDFTGDISITLAQWIFTGMLTAMLFFSLLILVFKIKKNAGRCERYLSYYKLLLLIFTLLAGGTVTWLITVSAGLKFGSFGLLLLLCAFIFLSLFMIAKVWRYLFLYCNAVKGFPAGKIFLCLVLTAFTVYGIILSWWTPFAWRSSDFVIRSVAKDLKAAGIYLQSTLVLYETGIGRSEGYKIDQLINDPVYQYLPKPLQERWKGIPGFVPDWMSFIWQRHPEFTRRLVKILHEEGVPIMAGTDAMGVPLVLPGSSLHKELTLLKQSGLTSYEVLRSATLIPARFLNKEQEYGTVSTGKRADLILVEKNPLDDLATLKQPIGVMVRGKWMDRAALDKMLTLLKE
jgi:hypothetical protein